MKVIIAGSRGITDYNIVEQAVKEAKFFPLNEVVSGGARGVDTLGEKLSRIAQVDLTRFIPDWEKDGRAAGFIRNKEMAEYADALIAVWDGSSKGTEHMIKTMKDMGKPVYVHECKMMS